MHDMLIYICINAQQNFRELRAPVRREPSLPLSRTWRRQGLKKQKKSADAEALRALMLDSLLRYSTLFLDTRTQRHLRNDAIDIDVWLRINLTYKDTRIYIYIYIIDVIIHKFNLQRYALQCNNETILRQNTSCKKHPCTQAWTNTNASS